MKAIYSSIVFLIAFTAVNAQSLLPYDSATAKITYRYSIKRDKRLANDATYKIVQDWFEQNSCEFKRCNLNQYSCVSQNVNIKNLAEVEKVFSNASPLQSIDPESNRITGKVSLKYTGDALGILKVLYVEYFMIVTVNEKSIDCQITDIRYNHFNPKSFLLQRINNWSDFTSLEPVNTLEYLDQNQKCGSDFSKFACFLNEDVEKLYSHLGNYVKSAKSLSLNTTP
ncbi:MAG: hypothetical protein IPN22_03995 [Bacteroidetes bacterium]|nr:hypothetical protein [Bacteroidota bacterium]